MPTPTSAKQVKQFLGLVGYYRKFVPRFADISRPLTKLTKKNESYNWTSECDKCFHMLKNYLQEAPILKYPDPEADYILYTDALKYAYAGVLTQKVDGTDHPVAYTSGLFRGSQLNWVALTKEAYAIYMTVKKLSFYLDSSTITLRSDHLPLKKFLEKNTMNAKVNNWAVELESQNINFEFISGVKNVLTDTLSRLIEMNEDVQQPPEKPGYEFGYTPFEELPPAKVTVIKEVIISEVGETEVLITHDEPTCKDIPVELPLNRSQDDGAPRTRQTGRETQKKMEGKLFRQESLHHGEGPFEEKDNHKWYTVRTHTCTRHIERSLTHASTQRTRTQQFQENLQCTEVHIPLERYETCHPETLHKVPYVCKTQHKIATTKK